VSGRVEGRRAVEDTIEEVKLLPLVAVNLCSERSHCYRVTLDVTGFANDPTLFGPAGRMARFVVVWDAE